MVYNPNSNVDKFEDDTCMHLECNFKMRYYVDFFIYNPMIVKFNYRSNGSSQMS